MDAKKDEKKLDKFCLLLIKKNLIKYTGVNTTDQTLLNPEIKINAFTIFLLKVD